MSIKISSDRIRVWMIVVLTSLGVSFVMADSTFIGIPSPAAGQSRLEKPLFKGVELYSWHDGQIWKFSLLIGTNRNKTKPEIMAKSVAVTGLKPLKARLGTLAIGENVVWSNPSGKPFAYPSADVIADLVRFCKGQHITLNH
jgi:hypothetical protein